MNKCINCGKDFVNPETLTCKFCGTKNPEYKSQEIKKEVKEEDMSDKIHHSNNDTQDTIITPIEKNINTIANVILTLGVISFIVIVYTDVFIKIPYEGITFNLSGFIAALITLFSSIIISSLMKLFRGISINIRRCLEELSK